LLIGIRRAPAQPAFRAIPVSAISFKSDLPAALFHHLADNESFGVDTAGRRQSRADETQGA
jgi:hypothetical protein